tara:strand:- start:2036 stop:2200 length:165 start_codon:yes stop_codon:yes gene_type:complete
MSKILVLNVDASPITVMSFERGLRMRQEPYRPTYMEFLSQHKNILEDWKPYVCV